MNFIYEYGDFEQISLNKKHFRFTRFIKEGENVMVSINTETDLPLSVDMPASQYS
jgi:elongation factor P